MISRLIDATIAAFSPHAAVRRAQARRILRSYRGAEANRLTSHRNPQNRSADSEAMGPFGADALRAWGRMLVRDNPYAWGAVDTIVSSVVGCGIIAQSMVEASDGSDDESTNEARDRIWSQWMETADVNGQYHFHEIQSIAQREMVEAGECLVHMVNVPRVFRGIERPVPFALELIEADRIATDRDTLRAGTNGNRIIRGVEIDDLGRPVAYYVYPDHPNSVGAVRQNVVRLNASNVRHLYRRDRIGQTRGISWFAPVVTVLRDLNTFIENELQASAVASCFTAAIKTNTPVSALGTPAAESDNTDSDGNQYDYLQPGMIMHLQPDEDISFGSPGRPNSESEPWISLMLRGIAVGTGLSYETVARDYSKTNYSSNRASQLEDRRRFRCWQQHLIRHLCNPVWHRFVEAAATAGRPEFPSMAEILADRSMAAPVEWQATGWEWVDPTKEQAASEAAITALQSTYADELGAKGKNWRRVLRQRAKEEAIKESLGLKQSPPAQQPMEMEDEQEENEQLATSQN